MAAFIMPAGDENEFLDGSECLMFDDDNTDQTLECSAPTFRRNGVTNRKRQTKWTPAYTSSSTANTSSDLKTVVMRGNLADVQACIQQGDNVNLVFPCGWTALMYAVSEASEDIVAYLLDKGARVNYSKDMFSVLMAACSSKSDMKTSVEKCVELLLEGKADVNARDRYHFSPLIYAAREGRSNVVQRLVQKGAAVNKQDSNGWTALSWAVSRSHRNVVQVLLDAKADPTKMHCDQQTAVDMARCDDQVEILALLEGRPQSMTSVNAANSLALSSTTTVTHNVVQSTQPLVNEEDTSQYIQYGELELFLCGLDLSHLVTLVREQKVDFTTFMRMTDHDLEKMGINQIGVRKKILDGIQSVHKKEWETTSIASIQYNRHIRCCDAVAMIANISKHTQYIGSSIGYITDQLRTHQQILEDTQDGSDPKLLYRHTQDAILNVRGLTRELGKLEQHMQQVLKTTNFEPPDVVKTKRRKKTVRRKAVAILVLTSVTVIAVVINRDMIVNHFISLIPGNWKAVLFVTRLGIC